MSESFESKWKKAQAGLPGLRLRLRRGLEGGVRLFSRKAKSEGALRRVTPDDGGEWFFGACDESPWDLSGKRVLALRADAVPTSAPGTAAALCVIEGGRVTKFAETRAWNVRQGCMLQWLGPDFRDRVIYNDFRDGKFVSVIFDLEKKRELRQLPMPVCAVSADGRTALAPGASRLRPGSGDSNLPDATGPDVACVWGMDLEAGTATPVLTYAALGALRAASELGIAVPRDLSIVGYDDLDISSMQAQTRLTTIRQPQETVGELAVQMLLDLIAGREVRSVDLSPELVVRET